MVETDRDQDASSNDRFAIVKNEKKPTRVFRDRDNASFVDLRHEAVLEGKTIGHEDVQRNCSGGLSIGKSLVSAISLQGEATRRIGQAGGETFRFQAHSDGHMCAPALHRPPENAKVDLARTQMAGQG